MGLHWGAPALRSLMTEDMWARIQSVQVDPSQPTARKDALNFMNAQSGETMAVIPVQNFYRLRRRKLRGLLVEDLDICYGKTLCAISYSSDGERATASFNDGSSISANLIVGTDGARSTLRRLVLGPKSGAIRRLPFSATFVQARFPAGKARFLRTFHPLYIAGINPEGFFSLLGIHDAPDPRDPECWTFFFYISWPSSLKEQEDTAHWSNAQRLQQVKGFAQSFTDPFRSAFEWLSDDHPVWCMGLSDFDPGAEAHRWDSHGGRVTVAGDAAHAMTYQRGQGLNHSVTDAAKLVEAVDAFALGKTSRQAAIASYEEEMIERAGGEVRLSTMNTEVLHNWRKVLQSPVLTSGMVRSQGNRSA
jgi:2-polyprenyl-6-methoxyphenol hydroxylase-like FAD-dependent oxidoreductase